MPQFSGLKIGLLGGSFDPPHFGHAHITREALKRFDLDEVWWLVSPGNPLKENAPASLESRMEAARAVIVHPKVKISNIESKIGTRFTAETLQYLIERHQTTKFVWLMGADNMAGFHLWRDWRWIMENVPVGILARPGQRISARMSRAALCYPEGRLRARQSGLLADANTPAWCFVNVPMMAVSSSGIRAEMNG